MSKPIKRYSLTLNQIHVLKLIYKFRFVTSSLLADYKGISRIASNKTLQILFEQEYIGQRYKSEYRLQGKGPRYYLATKGLKLLRDSYGFDVQTLHAMYKNKSVSDNFVDQRVEAMRVFLAIRHQYPDNFQIFAKSELGVYDFFPEPRPELYLNRMERSDKLPNKYLVDILGDVPAFVIKKRLNAYLEHYDSGDWEDETKTDYPIILLICPNSKAEQRIQEQTATILDNAGIDELKFYTTTIKALLSYVSEINIWSDVTQPRELVSL